MEWELRQEHPQDFFAAENLTREAFWNVYRPGCNEHHYLHLLRQSSVYLPQLSYLAWDNDTLIGSIHYSKSKILRADGTAIDTITFGPVGVLPQYQNKGVAGALIRKTLSLAAAQGHTAVLIFGDPRFYGRFGFHGGEHYNITLDNGKYLPTLLALELLPGILTGGGRFHEGFDYDDDDLAAFDTAFPAKEKSVRPSQAEFQVLRSLAYEVRPYGSL